MKPHIVFLTIDSLRADHLSAFGYKRPTTPFLDRFAGESMNFKKHFANASQTPGSFFSIFTSRYPLERQDWTRTNGPYSFLSEVLKKAGYRTAAFQTNPYLSRFFGYGRGFDDFRYFGPELEEDPVKRMANLLPNSFFRILKSFIKNTFLGRTLNRIRFFFLPQHAYADATEVNRGIEEFVRQRGDGQPLFLWAHYMDAHNPFLPETKHLRAVGTRVSRLRRILLNRKHLQLTRFDPFEDVLHMSAGELKDLEKCYDAKIRCLDEKLEELHGSLKKLGLTRENTIWLITSDHGEAFGEHFGIGHTERLYDEVTHVPFLLNVPGTTPVEREDLSCHLDILPTLAGLGGVSGMAGLAGRDLLRDSAPDQIYAQIAPNKSGTLSDIDPDRAVFALRTQEWKLIHDRGRGREEFYHLPEDPTETKNVFGERTEAGIFQAKLQKHIAQFSPKH